MYATSDLNALAVIYASNVDDAHFKTRDAQLAERVRVLQHERAVAETSRRRRGEVELHLSRARQLALERRLEELRRNRYPGGAGASAPTPPLNQGGAGTSAPTPPLQPRSVGGGDARSELDQERERFTSYVERSASGWTDAQVHSNEARARALRRQLGELEAARRRVQESSPAAAGAAYEVADLQVRVAYERQQLVQEKLGVAGLASGPAHHRAANASFQTAGYSAGYAGASPPQSIHPLQLVPYPSGPMAASAGNQPNGHSSAAYAQGETAIHIQQDGGTCNIYLPARSDGLSAQVRLFTRNSPLRVHPVEIPAIPGRNR